MTLTLDFSIPAPDEGSAGLAWDGTHLWHADYSRGEILKLNAETGDYIASLRCPGNLAGLAWDGRSLWQSLYDEGLVRQVNPLTNDFDGHIDLSEYGWLSGCAWDGELLWVVAQQRGLLLGVETESGRVTRTVEVPVAVGDIDYQDGSFWLSTAAPMQFDHETKGFEWVGEPTFGLLQTTADGVAKQTDFSADGLYTGLAWTADHLWLARAGAGQLYCYSAA